MTLTLCWILTLLGSPGGSRNSLNQSIIVTAFLRSQGWGELVQHLATFISWIFQQLTPHLYLYWRTFPYFDAKNILCVSHRISIILWENSLWIMDFNELLLSLTHVTPIMRSVFISCFKILYKLQLFWILTLLIPDLECANMRSFPQSGWPAVGQMMLTLPFLDSDIRLCESREGASSPHSDIPSLFRPGYRDKKRRKLRMRFKSWTKPLLRPTSTMNKRNKSLTVNRKCTLFASWDIVPPDINIRLSPEFVKMSSKVNKARQFTLWRAESYLWAV